MNRFQKRQEKRRQIFFEGLSSSQIAEIDENGRIVVTTFQGYIKKFEPAYYQKSPTLAENLKVEMGDCDEMFHLDNLIREGKPVFEDKLHGVTLYR